MSDPAVLLDQELQLICFSPSFPELTGLRRRPFMNAIKDGTSVFEMIGSDQNQARSTAQTCLDSRKPMHFAEEIVRNLEDLELTVQMSYLPVLDEEGDALGVILSYRDVSAEARLQGRYRALLHQERLRAENLEREVEKRTRELTVALEEVTRLSRVDPLTGLLNRRAFTELAEQAIKLARRHGRSMGLLLGDIDFFKKVNDHYGHVIGDKILIATAGAMSRAVRDSDPVARFGGEEFVILLTETERGAVGVVGERVRQFVSEVRNNTGDGEVWPDPTISLGMTVFPEHGDSLDELITNADKALYRAKESGRNRVEMYSEEEFEAEAPGTGLPRRQVLMVGSRRADQFARQLEENYQVIAIDDDETALQQCEHSEYQVLVADHRKPEDGVEFLRRSLRYRPEALRILIIDTQEVFVEVRGSTLARVDSFLLRDEAVAHLSPAIDDGLVRREQDRHRVMMQADSVRRLYSTRVDELETIINERQIDFAYQPIVDPVTRKVFAYEALCRARHPIFRNPQVLFDAALQSGKLWELGRVTREVSIRALEKLPPDVKIFMNLHPGEVEDPELVSFKNGAFANRVVFEITERASIPDYVRFKKMIAVLSKLGYQFAIDDLGAGYAGLNAVALLSPEFIKIDMAMVRGINAAPQRAKLIRRIVDFANDIHIRLIAEGIETREEAETIASLGCHLTQGYYYGRPSETFPTEK